MQNLSRHWQARSLREKRLLCGLGGVLLVWAFVAGLWQPLHDHRAGLIRDIALYDRAAAAIVTQTPGVALPPVDDRPLSVILTASTGTFNLAIRRLQPVGAQVSLTLEDAPFDTVLPWLASLEKDLGLRILTLDMARRPAPGVITASLTVGR